MALSDFRLPALVLALASLPACGAEAPEPAPVPAEPAASRQASLLARSSPADGATLSKSPAELTLRFTRPARLLEVTVAGSDGSLVPMMITAVEEVETYSTPLPDLPQGRYAVTWRAASGGQIHQGEIRFTVR